MVVTSPECVDPYTISDSCGISASSALSEETLPRNVIRDDDTYWAPAIRSDSKIEKKITHNISNLTFEELVLDGKTF